MMSGQAATAGVHNVQGECKARVPLSLLRPRSGGRPARDSTPSPGPSPPLAVLQSHAPGAVRTGRAGCCWPTARVHGRDRDSLGVGPGIHILHAALSPAPASSAPAACPAKQPPTTPEAPPKRLDWADGGWVSVGTALIWLICALIRPPILIDPNPTAPHTTAQGTRRPSSSSARRAAPLVGSTRGRRPKPRRRQEKGRAPAPRSER